MTDHTIPTATCPIDGCDAALYLIHEGAIPLYTIDPPWPNAGRSTYQLDAAVSIAWEVECGNGHKVWNNADQARTWNRTLPEDSEDTVDTTGDYAMTFDPTLWPYDPIAVPVEATP